jgi:hypothetical protein
MRGWNARAELHKDAGKDGKRKTQSELDTAHVNPGSEYVQLRLVMCEAGGAGMCWPCCYGNSFRCWRQQAGCLGSDLEDAKSGLGNISRRYYRAIVTLSAWVGGYTYCFDMQRLCGAKKTIPQTKGLQLSTWGFICGACHTAVIMLID